MSAHRKSGPAVLGPPRNWKEPKHLSQCWDSDDTRRYDEYAMTHRLLAEEQQREVDRVAGEEMRLARGSDTTSRVLRPPRISLPPLLPMPSGGGS